MTTADHAAGRPAPDWKVTPAYRVLIKVGWAAVAIALYGSAVATVVGITAAWWMTAGMAAFALLVAILLPAPVPSGLLTEGRTTVDTRQPVTPPADN
jgi:hypothetical protein